MSVCVANGERRWRPDSGLCLGGGGCSSVALLHELARGLARANPRPFRPLRQKGIDGFGGGGHRERHLVHSAIDTSADPGPSELHVRENERL